MVDEPNRGAATDEAAAEIKTFLIADVRGYTLFTQERGDEAAGKLAKRFAEVAREGVDAHGGSVLELRGDEALCVFASTRQAIRAAVELQIRFVEETVADPSLPLRVGIGIDAGEAVAVEGGYRGGALNLAARLCGHAGPGEVLASREAVHLARKVDGIRYLDKGQLRMKGLPEPVHVNRVLPEAGDPAKLLEPYAPSKPGLRLRRRALVIGSALVVGVVLVALLVPTLRDTQSPAEFRPGTVLLDLKTGQQVGFVPPSSLAVTGYPKFSGGHFWVNNFFPASYVEIDPRTGEILKQLSSPSPDPDARGVDDTETPFAVDGKYLWVSSGDDLVKIDVERGNEVDRFRLDEIVGQRGRAEGVAVGGGSVWVGRDVPPVPYTAPGQIVRLDPETGAVEHLFEDMSPHVNLSYGNDGLWVADDSGVARIDPRTNLVTEVPEIREARLVTSGGGFGWASDGTKGVVYKIDRAGGVVATYNTGLGAYHMSFDDGVLWVANSDEGTVTGIDALTGKLTPYRFGHPVSTVAAGDGVLLVRVEVGRSVEDSIDALTGDVARFFAEKGEIWRVDPALDSGPGAFQIAYATCARLLNYPDAPAPDGWRLQPEIATAMPTVSSDGLTYAFTVRPGYRFSPPENDPVTAETFRYSIERALSPELGNDTPGPQVIDDIEGERAFRNGEADHISGLQAEGDTLSITLVEPSPDFLQRLAMPYFCPVPTDTPLVAEGAFAAGSNELSGGHIPSTGPYYVADHSNEEYVILKQNPNYSGPRPQGFDAIAIREGVDASVAVDRVDNEGWDGILNLYDPLLDPTGALAERWGPESAAAAGGDQRYYPVPHPGVDALAFNAGRPPFADPEIRRAAALALDRAVLAAAYAEVPSAQLLPPSQTGYEEGWDPFPLHGPELAEAKALMHRRRFTATLATYADCDPCRQWAEAVRVQLDAVGIRVRIEEVPDPSTAIREPGADFDLFEAWDIQEYHDPASVLTRLFGGIKMVGDTVPPSWLPPGVHSSLARLRGLTGSERVVRAEALARRLAAEELPATGFAYLASGQFYSNRLGCKILPPFGYGVDLAALCLSE